MPALRRTHARTDVVADPFPALTVRHRREDVETGFEPGRESLCDFQRFVQFVFGGQDTLLRRLGSLEEEVTVQFHHGCLRWNRLRAINLDLVVVLGMGGRAAESDGE